MKHNSEFIMSLLYKIWLLILLIDGIVGVIIGIKIIMFQLKREDK